MRMIPALERLESPQAATGTLCHMIIAQILGLIYHGDGPTWNDPDWAFDRTAALMARLTDWDREVVRRCVAYAIHLVDRHKPNRDGILIERKLPGHWIGVARGGTIDFGIIVMPRVIIADWKAGFLDQGPADEHEQSACYACMAWDKYQPDEVEVHLAQGRLSPRRRFSAAVYDAAAIERARVFAVSFVKAALMPDAAINPTIKACRYCKALVVCRAARERIMKANEELAMFGPPESPEERMHLAESAQIAARFAATVKDLQKEWVREQQGVAS